MASDSTFHPVVGSHYVVFDSTRPSSTSLLLLFLPATNATPAETSEFEDEAATGGYRVIGLRYRDVPGVMDACPHASPDCPERIRQQRVFGDLATGTEGNGPSQSIVHRLTALLTELDRAHPEDGWKEYLDDGHPRWRRVAVAGLSQGAGMAAFIAQREAVARVILFSGPFDNYGVGDSVASWLRKGHGATETDHWYAAYHARERMARVIERSYAALRIPQAHIRVLTRDDLPKTPSSTYHLSVVSNGATPRRADGRPAYLRDWLFLLGLCDENCTNR